MKFSRSLLLVTLTGFCVGATLVAAAKPKRKQVPKSLAAYCPTLSFGNWNGVYYYYAQSSTCSGDYFFVQSNRPHLLGCDVDPSSFPPEMVCRDPINAPPAPASPSLTKAGGTPPERRLFEWEDVSLKEKVKNRRKKMDKRNFPGRGDDDAGKGTFVPGNFVRVLGDFEAWIDDNSAKPPAFRILKVQFGNGPVEYIGQQIDSPNDADSAQQVEQVGEEEQPYPEHVIRVRAKNGSETETQLPNGATCDVVLLKKGK